MLLMGGFWSDYWHGVGVEFERMFARVGYLLKHGQLHPEVWGDQAVPRPHYLTRLWDKDWNLLGSYEGNDPIYATVDIQGHRWSGRVEIVEDTAYLDKMLTWQNPFLEEVRIPTEEGHVD